MDRFRSLYILEEYGVGHRAICLICRYSANLQMVARAGGYYGAPFCGERGMTQGEPPLPTIFNLVVDAVICHWNSLVAGVMGCEGE